MPKVFLFTSGEFFHLGLHHQKDLQSGFPQSCVLHLSGVDGSLNATMCLVRERFLRRRTQHKNTIQCEVASAACFSNVWLRSLLWALASLRWASNVSVASVFPSACRIIVMADWRANTRFLLRYYLGVSEECKILSVTFPSSLLNHRFASIERTVTTVCVWRHHSTLGVAVDVLFIQSNLELVQRHATFGTIPDFVVFHSPSNRV